MKLTKDKEFYDKVYDILVKRGGATESDRKGFILAFTSNPPANEFRFMGKLGYGGKYWKRNEVNCYPEDIDTLRVSIINDINKELNKLWYLSYGQ